MYNGIGQKRYLICFLLINIFIFPYCLQSLAAPKDDAGIAQLRKQAQKEGKLVFYTVVTRDSEILVKEFQKKYPFIEVDRWRGTNPIVLNRVIAERRAKKNIVDVINTKGSIIYLMKTMGLLSKYLSPERKFYVDGFKDKEGYWTTIQPVVQGIVYNTRMLAPNDVPTTYQDLLKPRWKGKIGSNPLQFTWPEQLMQLMGKEEAIKYMKDLAQQNLVVRTGSSLNVMLTAAKEVPLSLPVNADRIWVAKAEGAPVDWVRMKPPYYADLRLLALAADAPHPNASKLFIDYCLSQEGQTLWAALGNIPARKGINSPIKSEEMLTIDPALGDNTAYYEKLIKQIFIDAVKK